MQNFQYSKQAIGVYFQDLEIPEQYYHCTTNYSLMKNQDDFWEISDDSGALLWKSKKPSVLPGGVMKWNSDINIRKNWRCPSKEDCLPDGCK